MTKSKLFKSSADLATMYINKAVYFNKRSNLIEYVCRYSSGKYAVKCYGINAAGVAFSGSVLDSGKYTGFFWFQVGPDAAQVQGYINNPETLY